MNVLNTTLVVTNVIRSNIAAPDITQRATGDMLLRCVIHCICSLNQYSTVRRAVES